MRERQFTDGGVLGARVLASVGRVRREACFHRDDDRKLGGGRQGLECCGLSRRVAGGGEVFGGGGRGQNPNPSHTEGFGTPASFSGALGGFRCRAGGFATRRFFMSRLPFAGSGQQAATHKACDLHARQCEQQVRHFPATSWPFPQARRSTDSGGQEGFGTRASGFRSDGEYD